MARYDFQEAILVSLSIVQTHANSTWLHFGQFFSYELGQIMTQFYLQEAGWMILSNVQTDFNIT